MHDACKWCKRWLPYWRIAQNQLPFSTDAHTIKHTRFTYDSIVVLPLFFICSLSISNFPEYRMFIWCKKHKSLFQIEHKSVFFRSQVIWHGQALVCMIFYCWHWFCVFICMCHCTVRIPSDFLLNIPLVERHSDRPGAKNAFFDSICTQFVPLSCAHSYARSILLNNSIIEFPLNS